MNDNKFRAWDGEKFIYFGLTSLIIDAIEGDVHELYSLLRTGNFSPDRYTGLKDSNGVGIFEGDILGRRYSIRRRNDGQVQIKDEKALISFGEYETEDYEGTSSVSWLYAGYPITQKDIQDASYNNPYWDLTDGSVALEVIGNIYENPELLKGGDAAE